MIDVHVYYFNLFLNFLLKFTGEFCVLFCRRYLIIEKEPILKMYPPKSAILNVDFAPKLEFTDL